MGRTATDRMRTRLRAALACAALSALAWASPAAAGGVSTERVDPARDGFWTAERMLEAVPAELPVPDPGANAPVTAPDGPPLLVAGTEPGAGPVAEITREVLSPTPRAGEYTRDEIVTPSDSSFRMHGKVFFTISGGSSPGNFVCSGTAISSNNRSVVWTAGHCVNDADFGGGFASNWTFVPGYKNGSSPFGQWPAKKLATTPQWANNANLKYDMGAAVVAENGSGQALTEVVGSRGIGFNQARSQNYQSFGYPAQAPPAEFTGGREFRCNSTLGGTDNPGGSGPLTSWIGCDMTGGSSGGGWIAGGTLLSVNSYSYCDALGLTCQERLYGPYLDSGARDLYDSVTGKAKFCLGKPVTHLGSPGNDTITGTDGRDVIKAGGGNDRIKAGSGNDRVCAGGGKDKVSGNDGKDTLNGQKGKDDLSGGKGRKDTCKGGKGKDKAQSCERVSQVP